MTNSVDECDVISAVNEAGSAGGAQALTTIAWRLYGQLGFPSTALAELWCEMAALPARARAAVAGDPPDLAAVPARREGRWPNSRRLCRWPDPRT